MDREHRPPGVRPDRRGAGEAGGDGGREALTGARPQARERAERDASLDTDETIAERVTAIIVHYGDPALTWRAVGSIVRSPPDAEIVARIVVVDNHPERRLGERPPALGEAEYRGRIEVVVSETNLGFGGGVNLALQRVDDETEEFVFVLNNDAQIAPRAIRRLVLAARRHPERALLAPLILVAPSLETIGTDDRDMIWAAGGVVDLGRARAYNYLHLEQMADASSALAQEPRIFVSGCAFLARTTSLLQVGAFDEAFFLYYEDVDLCLRLFARAKGEACLFVPQAVVFHEVSQGLGFSPAQYFFNWRNRGWVVRRHAIGSDRRNALAYLVLAAGAHAFGAIVRGRFRQALSILRGAMAGAFRPCDPIGDKLLR